MLRRVAWAVISWLPVGVVFSDNVATLHHVSDSEMAPAVAPNTLCLVRRSKRPSALVHGQVVAVRSVDGSRTMLRRVIGLGGDYVQPRDTTDDLTFVPPGFAWLEADHPQTDTESEGTVAIAIVVGRVTRVLPSGHAIAIIPSERAFPSGNQHLYIGSQ